MNSKLAKTVRNDFPILTSTRHFDEQTKELIYFDSAATSQKSTVVVDNMKTYKQIMTDLHHEKKTVDCEKCEYDQCRQWLKDCNEMEMVVSQVLIELHNSMYSTIMDKFAQFQKMLHKEANYLMRIKVY